MKIAVLVLTVFINLAAPALAAERIIELADGSQIRGDVVSMSNDKFVVRTRSLGTVTLEAGQVVDMRAPKAQAADPQSAGKTPAASPATSSGNVSSITATLAGNPQLMGDVMALRDDPRMKAILSDPALMKAVQDLDFNTLANDPRIKALMQSPAVKKIQSQVQ